jgi:Na+-transporting NADH:ubiquinone oxidoreductase subunit NqrC
MQKLFLTIVMTWVLSTYASASELTHEFKNPSFSGKGYSTHVLSIEQLQFQRKQELEKEKAAAVRQAERDKAQETLSKFLANVESRIYANLSKNLVDSMFSDTGANSGTATVEGATIYWVKDASSSTITVQITEADGTFSELIVPLSGFGF